MSAEPVFGAPPHADASAAAADRDAAARAVAVGVQDAFGRERSLLKALDSPGSSPFDGFDRLLARTSAAIGALESLPGAVVVAEADRIEARVGDRVIAEVRMLPAGLRGTVRGHPVADVDELIAATGSEAAPDDDRADVDRRVVRATAMLVNAAVVDAGGDGAAPTSERSRMAFVVAGALGEATAEQTADPEATQRLIAAALAGWSVGEVAAGIPDPLRSAVPTGGATSAALSALAGGGHPGAGASADSAGSGPLTWCAAIGARARWSVPTAAETARLAAALTHSRVEVTMSAAALAAIIRMLVAGRAPRESVLAAQQLIEGREGLGRRTVSYLLGAATYTELPADRDATPVGGTADAVLSAALAEFVGPGRREDPHEAVERMRRRRGEGRSAAVVLAQLFGAAGTRVGGDADASVEEYARRTGRRLGGEGERA